MPDDEILAASDVSPSLKLTKKIHITILAPLHNHPKVNHARNLSFGKRVCRVPGSGSMLCSSASHHTHVCMSLPRGWHVCVTVASAFASKDPVCAWHRLGQCQHMACRDWPHRPTVTRRAAHGAERLECCLRRVCIRILGAGIPAGMPRHQ